jgi:endonuclease/exonuclease/phosphatase family metal-dependent hydrolase
MASLLIDFLPVYETNVRLPYFKENSRSRKLFVTETTLYFYTESPIGRRMAEATSRFSLRILTINTHKGFTAFNRRFILPELREAVRSVGADIVCLQEVLGAHDIHALQIEGWPATPHYEFLADTLWQDYAYGRNAMYPEGHHGNAVLSRYPIAQYENLDISVSGHEKRGLLHCVIALPRLPAPVHIICAHLGLRERHRTVQLRLLAEHVNRLPANEPVVVAGDFNDWRQRANRPLRNIAGLDEVFTRAYGRPARTFPVRFPLLRLDRIYVKNASASHPEALTLHDWRHLSDHAPLAVEIHL